MQIAQSLALLVILVISVLTLVKVYSLPCRKESKGGSSLMQLASRPVLQNKEVLWGSVDGSSGWSVKENADEDLCFLYQGKEKVKFTTTCAREGGHIVTKGFRSMKGSEAKVGRVGKPFTGKLTEHYEGKTWSSQDYRDYIAGWSGIHNDLRKVIAAKPFSGTWVGDDTWIGEHPFLVKEKGVAALQFYAGLRGGYAMAIDKDGFIYANQSGRLSDETAIKDTPASDVVHFKTKSWTLSYTVGGSINFSYKGRVLIFITPDHKVMQTCAC